MPEHWFQVMEADQITSPALLVYVDRVEENIRRTIKMAGSAGRLRPHVKTHKMPDIIRMQLAHGITKFKAATIAEMEMVAEAGGKDILLAYQPVGPNIPRLRDLTEKFPDVRFAAVADDPGIVSELDKAFSAAGKRFDVYVDVDCGMHRTGIEPGAKAIELYAQIHKSASLHAGGLHAYDGHNHEADLGKREEQCEVEFALVGAFAEELANEGMPVPELVAGGTPTFPIHARHPERTCSPGTVFLWDYGYGMRFPDLDFLVAAVLLTRIVSRPSGNRICLDLGHKSVAAENPHPRVRFLNLMDGEPVMQSEEHLVLESTNAANYKVGQVLYGVPRHVCPSVALYSRARTIKEGHLTGEWEVRARRRKISV